MKSSHMRVLMNTASKRNEPQTEPRAHTQCASKRARMRKYPHTIFSRARVDTEPTVLHVTESLGGGVLAAITDYVAATPEFAHHILYAVHADAPIPPAALSQFASATQFPRSHLARILSVRHTARSLNPTKVHAHSSFGGFYARTALSTARVPIIYTPHCYAFERQDIHTITKAIYRSVESMLARNTSTFAACSPREAELSRWPQSRAAVEFLPNVAPGLPSGLGGRHYSLDDESILLVGAGRPSPQKDPGFFLRALSLSRDAGLDVKGLWIGGDPGFGQKGNDLGIIVTGWLPRHEALRMLATADLYIHTGRWEGFPIAVLEALALGVPTIVRDIPAFEGLTLPKVSDEAAVVAFAREASTDTGRRALWSVGSAAVTLFTRERQSSVLARIYGDANA